MGGKAEIKRLTNAKQWAGTPVYHGQSSQLESLSAPVVKGDKFKTFLNNDYIKFINNVQSSHIIYDNLLHLRLDGVSPVVFNHHNLKNEETYNAYKRRCYRFLNEI